MLSKDICEKILNWIDENFCQDNMPNYYVPYKLSNRCIVFFHGIGGIILYERWFQTFSEDDGHFFINDTPGIKSSSAWLDEYCKCFKVASDYLKEFGKPYYFNNTNIICGYELE